MRNPTVSKVIILWKNELKYTKSAQSTSLLPYCLERYDCFSIYKIESGQFNFLKFCMHNTAIAYVGGHLTSFFYTQPSTQHCMEENSSSAQVKKM